VCHRAALLTSPRCCGVLRLRFADPPFPCTRHRKPENLLLDENGQLKVTDLGVSSEVGEDGICTLTSGTRPYMAPEVRAGVAAEYACVRSPPVPTAAPLTTAACVRSSLQVFITGHSHTYTADYYSLGITTFQLLLGHRPYKPDTANMKSIVRAST
jgi:serine/threonine protein kinase